MPNSLDCLFFNPVRLVWSLARTFCETSGMKQKHQIQIMLSGLQARWNKNGVECPLAIGRGMALGTRKNPWGLKVAGIHSCLIYGFISAKSHYKSTVCSPECCTAHAQLTWLSLFQPSQTGVKPSSHILRDIRHETKASNSNHAFWLASSLK